MGRIQALMFIELTDHLRCPADHAEAFLVLLPGEMAGRSVRAGELGCPICDRRFALRDGVLDLGEAPPAARPDTALTAEAIAALAGLGGPGGYLVLVGPAAAAWRDVEALVPGVGLVAVNPPATVMDDAGISVLRSGRLPLKSGSMRAVVLGGPFGGNAAWVGEAARVTLPGLRVVGEGAPPEMGTIELLATAGGVWVGTRSR